MRKAKLQLKRLRRDKRGFTFVECIVAVAIFAIVGTMAASLFSNSARYMSTARREEVKQEQAQYAALRDTFKNADGLYNIYPASVLTVTAMPAGDAQLFSYYITMTYATDYGDVQVMTPVALAPSTAGNQPGNPSGTGDNIAAYEYRRYMVVTDGYVSNGSSSAIRTGRYIYIYVTDVVNEIGQLAKENEYN